MTHTSGNRLDLHLAAIFFSLIEIDLGWRSNLSCFTNSKLTEFLLTPTVQVAIICDSQGVDGTSSDTCHSFLVEELDEHGNRGDINLFSETELAFETSAPSVQITLISQDEGVVVTASDRDNSLVLKGLQDHGSLRARSTTVSSGAELASTLGEKVPISGKGQSVVGSTSDLEESSHVVVLLGSRETLVLSLLTHP